MKNKFVDTLLFLEEFQLKEAREKQAFFSSLKDNLDMVPADVAKYKILPKLIEACVFQRHFKFISVSWREFFYCGRSLSAKVEGIRSFNFGCFKRDPKSKYKYRHLFWLKFRKAH